MTGPELSATWTLMFHSVYRALTAPAIVPTLTPNKLRAHNHKLRFMSKQKLSVTIRARHWKEETNLIRHTAKTEDLN